MKCATRVKWWKEIVIGVLVNAQFCRFTPTATQPSARLCTIFLSTSTRRPIFWSWSIHFEPRSNLKREIHMFITGRLYRAKSSRHVVCLTKQTRWLLTKVNKSLFLLLLLLLLLLTCWANNQSCYAQYIGWNKIFSSSLIFFYFTIVQTMSPNTLTLSLAICFIIALSFSVCATIGQSCDDVDGMANF